MRKNNALLQCNYHQSSVFKQLLIVTLAPHVPTSLPKSFSDENSNNSFIMLDKSVLKNKDK